MPRSYTASQTGAIACLFACAMWGLTAHAVALMLGLSHYLYTIIVIVLWILIPFCLKLTRQAFVLGMYMLAVGMAFLLVTPTLMGTAAWYTLARGLYDFTYVVWYLAGSFGVYFCYRSWKELQKTA